MSSGWTSLAPDKIVSFDDRQAQVSIAATGDMANLTTIVSFRTKPGLRGFITSFRQAWDGNLDPDVRYSLRINGAIIADYNQLQAQIAPPEQDSDLPVPIEVGQLSLVEMVAFVVSGNVATFPGTVTGRLVVKYINP